MTYKENFKDFLKKAATKIAAFSSDVGDYISQQLSPRLLVCLILGFAIVLLGVLIFPENPKEYLILISAIAIIIGVLVTSAVTLHSQMRDRAFELLKTNRDDDSYKKSMSEIARFFKQNHSLTQGEIIKIYQSSAEEDCVFRANSATHSEVNRPPIPKLSGH
jgi:uncharacterized membrane protein YqgA involved in biofilm formation